MKKIILIWALALVGTMQLQAQQPFGCGVGAAEGAAIKQALMNNRQLFTKQEVTDLMTNRVITYIPLSIHNVKNTAGEGRTADDAILGFLCGLNAIYADQDIQFFIYNNIIEMTNDFIDANSNTLSAKTSMLNAKIGGTVNIYVGRSTFYPGGGAGISYYDPTRDFLFFQAHMVSSAALTEAHEVGHFFTLNHTFYGWEGIDAETQYGGQNAPATVGGETTELVTRGAGANCSAAADGFCDTPADYHSVTALPLPSCVYNPTVLDPTGAALDPDETNLMSYYEPSCPMIFSTEQKAAIAMDVAARTWVSNTPPSTATVTGLASPVYPLDGALLGSISNPTVLLDWSDVPGATWYYLEVYGTNVPPLWVANLNDPKFKGIITTGSSYNLSTAGLTAGAFYAWRVKALNQYSTCATISGYSKFQATTTVTAIKDLPIEQQMTLKVNNNPISSSDIPLTVHSAEEVIGSIRIYAMDGRELATLTKQTFNKGQSLVQIPAQNMANGTYLAVLTTDRGNLQQKFVIQR